METEELLSATRRAYDLVFKAPVETAVLKAAHELNLLQALAPEPLTLEQLALRIEALPIRLERFLITLAQMGLVAKEGELWGLTELSRRFFVAPAPEPNHTMLAFVDYMFDLLDSFYMRLADVVRGDVDFTSMVPHPPRTREDSVFYETLHRTNAFFPIKLLRERARLDGVTHLLDAGGGIGDIAAALCETHPALNVSLINLPSAQDLVRENVAARGLAGRIAPITVDLYRDPYPPCDAVLFSRIMYPMNAQLCTMLCARAFEALPPGGRILICDMVIDDANSPNYDYLSHYLCAVGMPYSVLEFKSHREYPAILAAAGFADVAFDEAYDHVLYQAVKPA